MILQVEGMIGVQNPRFLICDDIMEIRDEVVFITIKGAPFSDVWCISHGRILVKVWCDLQGMTLKNAYAQDNSDDEFYQEMFEWKLEALRFLFTRMTLP